MILKQKSWNHSLQTNSWLIAWQVTIFSQVHFLSFLCIPHSHWMEGYMLLYIYIAFAHLHVIIHSIHSISNKLTHTTLKHTHMLAYRLNETSVDKPVFSRTGGTSDPLVRFKIEGFPNQETPYIQKNLNPRWNYQLVWPRLFNAELSLTVIVEDFNNLTSRTFMGKVSLFVCLFVFQSFTVWMD